MCSKLLLSLALSVSGLIAAEVREEEVVLSSPVVCLVPSPIAPEAVSPSIGPRAPSVCSHPSFPSPPAPLLAQIRALQEVEAQAMTAGARLRMINGNEFLKLIGPDLIPAALNLDSPAVRSYLEAAKHRRDREMEKKVIAACHPRALGMGSIPRRSRLVKIKHEMLEEATNEMATEVSGWLMSRALVELREREVKALEILALLQGRQEVR